MRLRAFAVVALLATRTRWPPKPSPVPSTPRGAIRSRRASTAASWSPSARLRRPGSRGRPSSPPFAISRASSSPTRPPCSWHGAARMTGTLFLQGRDPGRALYDGFPPDSSVVAQETGLSARSLLRAPADARFVGGDGPPLLYPPGFLQQPIMPEEDSLTRGASFMRAFASAHPGLAPRDAHPILDSLRARKSPAEQAMLRRAIDITVGAQREAMRTVRPGMYEYQVEALFQSAFRRTGGDGPRLSRSSARARTRPNTTTTPTIAAWPPAMCW